MNLLTAKQIEGLANSGRKGDRLFRVHTESHGHSVWISSAFKTRARFWQGTTKSWIDQTDLFFAWVRNKCRGNCFPWPNQHEDLLENPDEKNCHGIDFRGMDLRWKSFMDYDFSKADFRGADIRFASLSFCDLTGANLKGAKINSRTSFDYADRSKDDHAIPGHVTKNGQITKAY